MSKKNERTGDPETDEILDEMEADGIDVSGLGEKKPIETEDNSEEEVTDPELDESEEESEEEVEESEDDSQEEEQSDEDESEESDEEEEDESDTGDEAEGATKRLTLAQKYRREKKLRKESEAALAKVMSAKSDQEFDTRLKKYAEDHRMNIDAAKGMIDLAVERASLPKDVLDDFKNFQAERRNREYWEGQQSKFKKDFDTNVIPALQSLGKKDSDIAKVLETLNDPNSPNWAWSKSNKPKSLVQLALGILKQSGTRVSSENGGRRVRTQSGKAPEDMTPEDINDMGDEEFDKFSDKLGKSSKAAIHRS